MSTFLHQVFVKYDFLQFDFYQIIGHQNIQEMKMRDEILIKNILLFKLWPMGQETYRLENSTIR